MTTPHSTSLFDGKRLLARLILVVAYSAACILAVSLLAFLLGFMSIGFAPHSRSERARLDLKNIGLALKLYRTKTGHYPSTTEGLRALVSSQMLDGVPRDPWNAEYQYALQRGWPVAWSHGADRAPGGEGPDADLYNLGPLPLSHR